MQSGTLSPELPAGTPPRIFLHLLIFVLPFGDFLQTGVTAFNAAPIMGDVGASPEEYSLVATLYAVVAIGTIFNHRWLVERIGWRWVLRLSCLLYAAGAWVCAGSADFAWFAVGRMVTALGAGSFFTAGRVLVNHIPPSPRRFVGIKFFAAGIAWGSVGGPLLASTALALQEWRYAYAALLAPAAMAWLLAERSLPAGPLATRTPFDLRALLALVGGSALLLFALQRSVFDYFSDPERVLLCLGLALPVLALFVYVVLGRELPLIRFRELSQRRYLIGLAAFTVCYTILGGNNTVVPLLLLRGLNVPLELMGRFVAVGALGGVLVWILMARAMLPHSQGPTRYYLLGFGLLLAGCLLIARLSESVDPETAVLPALMCTSAFVIAVLSTTALQTFRDVQRDETVFSHANQVKAILSQFGVAGGVALATLVMQWRTTFHYVRLGEALSISSPALQQVMAQLAQRFASGHDAATASKMATASVNAMLSQEATFMAALDYFTAVLVVAALCLLAAAIERGSRRLRVRAPAAAAHRQGSRRSS